MTTLTKYKLVWIDCYNSANWSKKKLKESFPITKISMANDGWYECDHELSINASSVEELKKEVEKSLDTNGRIVDVFSVLDENNKVILIEEDF